MRRLIGLSVLFFCGLGVWLLGPYLLLPSGTTTIAWWYADTMRECSHEPAVGRATYWLPSAEQIADMDMQMAAVMFERERAGLTVPPPGQRFDGQYIGFTRKGVRYIYGHFFPSYLLESERWTADWSPFDKPMCMADGGRHFWGIVYDPEKKEVEQPLFNGPEHSEPLPSPNGKRDSD